MGIRIGFNLGPVHLSAPLVEHGRRRPPPTKAEKAATAKFLFFVVMFVMIGTEVSWWLAFGLLAAGIVGAVVWAMRSGDDPHPQTRTVTKRPSQMTLEEKARNSYGRSLSDGATESLFDE